MSDLLRELLTIRDLLDAIKEKASSYGYLENLPEIEEMQKLERSAFAKVNEWDKP